MRSVASSSSVPALDFGMPSRCGCIKQTHAAVGRALFGMYECTYLNATEHKLTQPLAAPHRVRICIYIYLLIWYFLKKSTPKTCCADRGDIRLRLLLWKLQSDREHTRFLYVRRTSFSHKHTPRAQLVTHLSVYKLCSLSFSDPKQALDALSRLVVKQCPADNTNVQRDTEAS